MNFTNTSLDTMVTLKYIDSSSQEKKRKVGYEDSPDTSGSDSGHQRLSKRIQMISKFMRKK